MDGAEAPSPSTSASVALLILYCIFYPIWLLLLAAWFILTQLYRPLAYLLLPLVYLARFLAACALLPLAAASKLETVYIFLGVAALVGLFSGLLLRSASGLLYRLLSLDSRLAPPRLRSTSQYREERQRQKLQQNRPPEPRPLSPAALSSNSLSLSDGARKGKQSHGWSAHAIMEEEDDESEF